MEDKLLNRIINVAYGNTSFIEKYKIKKLAQKRPDVAFMLEQYLETAKNIKRVEPDKCPNIIINNAKKISGVKKANTKSIFFDFYSLIFGRPIFSSIIAGVIALALISTIFIKRPDIHKQYTKQEIQLADEQVKQSLSLIANVFNKTKSTVEKDVLTNRISKPLKNSIILVNDFFTGDKNEKLN